MRIEVDAGAISERAASVLESCAALAAARDEIARCTVVPSNDAALDWAMGRLLCDGG